MRSRMTYTGAFLLSLTGIVLYSCDPDFSIAGTPKLALPLIIAGLVWGGLALNNPLRERRYHRRSQDGSLRVVPTDGYGYARHRGPQDLAARRFAGGDLRRPYVARGETKGVAMNAPAAAVGESFAKDSLRIATKLMKENRYDARGSMWAVLSGIVLSLTSSDLLLTDKELSLLEQGKILCTVTSLAIGLGLFVAGILAVDSVAGEKERATQEGVLSNPTKRGAMLLGKGWSVMATWLLIFVISAPYILLVGIGTRAQ